MTSFLKSTITAAFVAACSLAPLQAQAGLFDDEEARRAVLDLRNRIDSLRSETTSRLDSKADKNSLLDLSGQNDQLRQDIARLRGQIEVLTNEVANAQQRQKDFYVDLDNRLRKVEPQKITVDGRETSVDQSELRSYESAIAIYKAADYKGASVSMAEFLRRFPQSSYAPSVQYLLGTAYYAQRDYRNALVAQQAVVRNYPDNPKAADAMLNIASCYVELKDRPAARKTLETLVRQYPDSAAAQTATERLVTFK
ncbi:MAG: tol-pal system protein YbgF [Herminiimonas sp.]|nr:tol-pal system protein YbgF [Herminiimonas sp.]